MDQSLNHALEIGLAFVLFIIGLSLFIVMQKGIVTLSHEGMLAMGTESQVNVYEGNEVEQLLTVGDIYRLLTEDDLILEGISEGDIDAYESRVTPEIFIDGIAYKVVSDYKDIQNLKEALLVLPYQGYEKDYQVDDDGFITAIYLVGKD